MDQAGTFCELINVFSGFVQPRGQVVRHIMLSVEVHALANATKRPI